jgi:hypothetical protein
MARSRKIRVHKRYIHNPTGEFVVGGWLSGEHTYLWIGRGKGDDAQCAGFIQGKGLLQLARNIVREFERDVPAKRTRKARA